MGNTTIIELNHDLADEIDKNPEKFIDQIKIQLRTWNFSGQEILGGKVLAGFHRSGKTYEKWCKFKKQMGW